MKKLGLLVGAAFLLTACDATPGGNKDIMPVEHDEAVEHVDHHEGHDAHAEESHEAHAMENKDSLDHAHETHVAEPKDSAH